MEEVIGERAHEGMEYTDSIVTLRVCKNVRFLLPPMHIPSSSSNLKIVIRQCAAALKALRCCALYAVCVAEQNRLLSDNRRLPKSQRYSVDSTSSPCVEREQYGFQRELRSVRGADFAAYYVWITVVSYNCVPPNPPLYVSVPKPFHAPCLSKRGYRNFRRLIPPPPTQTKYSVHKLMLSL